MRRKTVLSLALHVLQSILMLPTIVFLHRTQAKDWPGSSHTARINTERQLFRKRKVSGALVLLCFGTSTAPLSANQKASGAVPPALYCPLAGQDITQSSPHDDVSKYVNVMACLWTLPRRRIWRLFGNESDGFRNDLEPIAGCMSSSFRGG